MNQADTSSSPTLRYFSTICPFCKPVTFFLKTNKIPHEATHLDLAKREFMSEEYKKINPFQKVPTILDGDYLLFETNTIMRYLANSRQVADHWYPKDAQKRGLVDLFFDWQSANILNLNRFVQSRVGFLKSISESEAKALSDKAFKELEDMFLSRWNYVASQDEPTIADLSLAWHLLNAVAFGYEFSPRVQEYYNLLLKIPGLKEDFDATEEEGKKFNAAIEAKKQAEWSC